MTYTEWKERVKDVVDWAETHESSDSEWIDEEENDNEELEHLEAYYADIARGCYGI